MICRKFDTESTINRSLAEYLDENIRDALLDQNLGAVLNLGHNPPEINHCHTLLVRIESGPRQFSKSES
jgi:hypothetical protein